jgi:transposase InsO family protein
LAEQMLDNAMLRDINSKKMVTPVGKQKAVVHLMEAHQVSQRRACDVLQVNRSSMRYLSCRGDDAELRDAIKRVSRERRRFGCRRIHVMIAREGFEVNHKKVRRIYREEKLQVRRRGGRKRALGTRKPMVLPPSRQIAVQSPAGQWTVAGFTFWRLLTTSVVRTWC